MILHEVAWHKCSYIQIFVSLVSTIDPPWGSSLLPEAHWHFSRHVLGSFLIQEVVCCSAPVIKSWVLVSDSFQTMSLKVSCIFLSRLISSLTPANLLFSSLRMRYPVWAQWTTEKAVWKLISVVSLTKKSMLIHSLHIKSNKFLINESDYVE